MINFKLFFKDIRFWIVFSFLLRLYGITNPPLEVSHNWRQTTVTMPARNFLEIENNIFYPRIDFAGEKTGITGMEFPLLNYLIYLVSIIFGYAHWYGRLINLIVSSLGLLFFYKIIKKYFSESMAFNATFILLFSIWFTYSRKIMPDTFSVSLILVGIYYGCNYLDTKRNMKNIVLYFAFVLFGVLSKLPSGCLLIIFIPFLINKKVPIKPLVLFILVSCIIISTVSIYYFYWVPYLKVQFQFDHFFMGKKILSGMNEVFIDWFNAIQRFCLDALQVVAFILFLIGIILAVKNRNKLLLIVFSASFLSFLIVVFKAGLTFTHHAYYMVPFTPIMALMAASVFEYIKKANIRWYLLILIMLESLANKYDDFIIKPNSIALLTLETELNKFSKQNDLIAINSGNVPTPMYFAHRKGWICSNEKLFSSIVINDFKSKGLRLIVVLKEAFGNDIILPYKKVFENDHFKIYDPYQITN